MDPLGTNVLAQMQTQVTPQPQQPQVTPQIDTGNLATIVTEWRRIHDEIAQLKQQASEKTKRATVLEGIIMNIMKQQNLGALDLKSSGGRILYAKKQRKSGLNEKVIQKLLTEHLKDETKAAEAVKYLKDKREAVVKEKLAYEKL
jgi:hypothetical protein